MLRRIDSHGERPTAHGKWRTENLLQQPCAGADRITEHYPERRTCNVKILSRRRNCERHWAGARRSGEWRSRDRKSTRLNSSHSQISYAVFCLKKKTKIY